MKVSVVIPYNSKYTSKEMLITAINSAKTQDVETEILVEEDNVSPSHGRNQGIKKSDGDYIAFLDADDVFLKGKLDKQIRKMKETGKKGCVECEEMSNQNFVVKLLKNQIRPKTSSLIIDSSLDLKFDEELERKEDDLAMIDIAMENEMCFINEKTTILRKHKGGLSASDNPFFIIETYKKFYNKVFEKYSELREYEPKSIEFFIFKNYISDLPSYFKRRILNF